ncbi:sn-glycerol-3-phosphate ABC transporter permease UgpA [Nisaea sp.]|uniref:sn-glycerol-3-phosphate ABC transporter permease UgpA n=1 Tax=Nisaea sp. TaxID=2024842 RepID=UPI003B52D31C
MRRVTFEGRWLPYLLLFPQLLILIWFFFWPAAQALYQAFTLASPFGGYSEWVWFENFSDMLSQPEYHKAIWVTLVFSAFTTALSLGLGLLFALFADRVLRATDAYRILLIWPYAVAPAIAGALWTFTLDPHSGVVAFAMKQVFDWGWNPELSSFDAMALVVFAAAWKQVAYNFVFFLAGLQSIPRSVIESAAMDGAGPLRRIRDIILPLLSPTTFFLIVLNVVYAFFDTFGIIHVTTEGGPGDATTILVYKVFRDGFIGLDLSASAAQSIILMVVVIALTVFQFRFLERRVHYSG